MPNLPKRHFPISQRQQDVLDQLAKEREEEADPEMKLFPSQTLFDAFVAGGEEGLTAKYDQMYPANAPSSTPAKTTNESDRASRQT